MALVPSDEIQPPFLLRLLTLLFPFLDRENRENTSNSQLVAVKMATNTFKIELPDAGNTLSLVSDISTIYVTEIKEIIQIKSYNNWVNPNESQIQLWCPNQSSRKLEVMEIHDEDQEELSSASVTVGILWKDEMKWTGVCKSKMRISPACIADSDVFFVLIEVNPNVLDLEAKTLLRTNAVRRWINSSYNALLQPQGQG